MTSGRRKNRSSVASTVSIVTDPISGWNTPCSRRAFSCNVHSVVGSNPRRRSVRIINAAPSCSSSGTSALSWIKISASRNAIGKPPCSALIKSGEVLRTKSSVTKPWRAVSISKTGSSVSEIAIKLCSSSKVLSDKTARAMDCGPMSTTHKSI